MIKRTFFVVFLIISFLPGWLYAQELSMPVHSPIYNFLYNRMLEGVIPEYDPYKIPLTYTKLLTYLDSLEARQLRNTGFVDPEIGEYTAMMQTGADAELSLLDEPERVVEYVFSRDKSAVYSYSDSLITFSTDLIGDFTYLTAAEPFKANSFLMSYGLKAQLAAGKNLAFSLAALNGNVYGSRQAALLDNRVKNSFTFNSTGINNFDYTGGYIRYSGKYGTLFAGREKFLLGASQVNRSLIGEAKQDFDMLSYDFSYKAVSLIFFHGWLVNPLTNIIVDSTKIEKYKPSKYISHARFNINFSDNFRAGITQIIMYAYRQPELGYMIPFLFWESVQRSFNDPDNSYLLLDFYVRPVNGIGITGEILVDDLNFDAYSSEGFNSTQNQTMVRLSAGFSDLIQLKNTTLNLEYTMIRPYTFSHPGYMDALSFTNNGVPLGDQINPNSVNYGIRLNWFPSTRLEAELKINYLVQGRNKIDDSGLLLENFGGDIHHSYTYFTPKSQALLEGEKAKTLSNTFICRYRVSHHLLFEYFFRLNSEDFKGRNTKTFFTGITLNYAPFGEKF